MQGICEFDGRIDEATDGLLLQVDLGLIAFDALLAAMSLSSPLDPPPVLTRRNHRDVDIENSGLPTPAATTFWDIARLNQTQNGFVRSLTSRLESSNGFGDIRVNQHQVNATGQRVGINRPDLQFTRNDRRYYVEFESRGSRRGNPHRERILANDPDAIVFIIVM